ncbi:acyl-CoA Delta-9 desaturase-like [Microplitis mediator]|uniref:acyl-CoA Delta-9 desaturase-like n=1 Tax=Microplitis mediator TaxID=375433 RepID=UPI00255249A0|nr:acyl-CoA Delta-9 desaturase-like [Microplitis mediator]XP_057337665.1 acyl-CoA Delta-9 desaturase-like [Microplitis mediator]
MLSNFASSQVQTESKVSIESENMIESVENTKRLRKKPWYEFETKIIWHNAIFLVIFETLAVYWTLSFPYWQQFKVFFWGLCLAIPITIGVTAGAHRMWTHRAYKAKTPLRIILAVFFYMAGQNSIFNWVRDHRVHHKYSETPADPHDSNRGFWFSHMGWLMLKKRPEVIQRGKGIDMSDILNDPVVQFFDGHHAMFKLLLAFVIPTFIPIYFFGHSWKWTLIAQFIVRYGWTLNFTWSVNSFAHMYGYRPYDKNIGPAENIMVSYVAGGEGWHNFHHAFPWDYKAAEHKSVFFNYTTSIIDMFAKIGWAYDLKQATPEQVKKHVEKNGDGTRAIKLL